MPLLRKATPEIPRRPVLAPIEGLDYSAPSTFINYRNGFPVNMRVLQGDLRKREGASQLGTDTIVGANGILHQGIYPQDDETIKILRMSKSNIEVYNTGTDSWDDITGTALIGGDNDYFDDAVAQNTYISTNSLINNIRKWAGTGNTALLGGNPPKCKFLEYLSPYLIAGFTDLGLGRHQKAQWTDTGNIEVWSGGNSGSALLRQHGGSPMRGLKNLNEVCVSYMKDAIYLGRNVDTTEVIKWDLAETGSGLMAHRAVVDFNGRHYYMGLDDFKVFDGVRSESIGKSVRDYVFPFRNTNKEAGNFALLIPEYEEVWFFVIMSGKTYPQDIWKYNYRYGFWYQDTCSNYRTAVQWYQQGSTTIDQMVGTIDAQAQRIDDFLSLTNSPLYVYGSSDGKSYKLDRTTNNDAGVLVDAKYDSIDFKGSRFEQQSRWLQLDFWAKGSGTLRLFYSTEYGINWKSITNVTLTSEFKRYRVFLDVLSERIRFRWLNNTLNETFSLRQFYPYYLDREEVPV